MDSSTTTHRPAPKFKHAPLQIRLGIDRDTVPFRRVKPLACFVHGGIVYLRLDPMASSTSNALGLNQGLLSAFNPDAQVLPFNGLLSEVGR